MSALGKKDVGGGRLRLRRRLLPFAEQRLALRQLSAWLLFLALGVSLARYFWLAPGLSALEFSQHVVGSATNSVGVLGLDAGDTDNDGDIDIVSAGLDGVKVYVRNESGVFEQKIIDDKDAERISIADFNNDGRQDLLVTFKDSPGVRWYQNNGDNEFSGTVIGTGTRTRAAAGDIDGDGAVDVVIAAREGSEAVVLRRWMNDGSGGFSSALLSADSGVTSMAIGDINGNGFRDVVTGGSQGLQHFDTSDGAVWAREDIDDQNNNSDFISIADVNGDGRPDIVTADQSKDTVAYYRHLQHSFFERTVVADDVDATTVQIVDLDEDGDEDIVAAAQDQNAIYWFSNNGSESFTRSTLASNLQTVFSVKVIDFDNDNDFDFVAGDHYRGTVYWYERTAAKPVASAPTNIQQTVDGAGRITFDVNVSDGDLDPTRMRIQYSIDGDHWYKPWLLSAKAAQGSVDLKNSNGYQVGTANAIDTDTHSSVKVSMVWDTKSVQNTGGPIVGDVNTVQLRVIPFDGKGNGATAVSSKFRVDNAGPANLANLRIVSIDEGAAELTWDRPTDSAPFSYELYYGTSHAAVLEQKSAVWDATDDAAMADVDTTGTTITDLSKGGAYTFKLFATDTYGNLAATPSIRGIATTASATPSSTPAPGSATPIPTATATPSPIGSPDPFLSPTPIPSPTLEPFPTTTPDLVVTPTPLIPTPEVKNAVPLADAGLDQVVNPSALVILDGTGSTDADGDTLSYRWNQLSGPNVDLLSERTATPSFSAGRDGQTYIFVLTVRDDKGAVATDTVTVATKIIEVEAAVPVEVDKTLIQPVLEEEKSLLALAIGPLNWALFVLSALTTLVSLVEHSLIKRKPQSPTGAVTRELAQGRVVHFQTNEAIAGARVLLYGEDGKLRRTVVTNQNGEFATDFPPGQYTLSVQATGFSFAPAGGRSVTPERGILYSGGNLLVKDTKPMTIVIPMKPSGQKVGTLRTRYLHVWQVLQKVGRMLSWPIFVMGALLNTFLIFWSPSAVYLIVEVLYVGLVIVKVVLEVRVSPAYGVVRDAITHVPLDLAVVRLYDQKTNRLIMTRVTNGQGKFFALPPAGSYRVTITKAGYGVFSRDNVRITNQQDSVLQMTADLMPVVPNQAFSPARSGIV